ncbi:MAG TPA: hypothetical protein VG737_18080 [Cyclobacteriaceae bacterium]|nr:hypothetical protein [Cyclobacteriaceae bacterium]
MRRYYSVVLLTLVFALPASAQRSFTSALQFTETVPADLLATRSVVLYDYTFKQTELEEVQKAFQQIGIDAIAYFESDQVMAGKDVVRAFKEYFNTRQVKYILFLEKYVTEYQIVGVPFAFEKNLFDPALPAWRLKNEKLRELMRTILQDSWRSQKKQNFLVNEFPETDIKVDPVRGTRNEFYAIDLKVDNLAVPKFGNETMDADLAQFFQNNYPLKYKLTEAGVPDEELRRQGFNYVLCYVHTRGKAAREVLGYDMTKDGNSYASITFPDGGVQLKTIPADKEIYKFYFRHIDNGNVFLGTKWDADVNWLDALRNHVLAFKNEARIP